MIDSNKKKKIIIAEAIVRDNKTCEEKRLIGLELPVKITITTNVFMDLNLDQMAKYSVNMISPFIKLWSKAVLTTRCIIASNKGTPLEVKRGDIDKKTKGPFILEHTHQLRSTVPIGVLPIVTDRGEDELLLDDIIKPTSLKFSNEHIFCNKLDLKWYRNAVCDVKFVEYNKDTLLDNLNMDYVDLFPIST